MKRGPLLLLLVVVVVFLTSCTGWLSVPWGGSFGLWTHDGDTARVDWYCHCLTLTTATGTYHYTFAVTWASNTRATIRLSDEETVTLTKINNRTVSVYRPTLRKTETWRFIWKLK